MRGYVCQYGPVLGSKIGVVHVFTADSNVTAVVACTVSYSFIELATCRYSLFTVLNRHTFLKERKLQ